VCRRFAALFGPARSSFEAQFWPFRRPQKVYLLHSLGEMDGARNLLVAKPGAANALRILDQMNSLKPGPL